MISAQQNFSGKTVLHIGTGTPCPEVNIYLSGGAKRIILVDADPRVARDLDSLYKSYDNITIQNKAVSNHSSDGNLNCLSLNRLSSLRSPTKVYDLFPGLALVESLPVKIHDVSDLIETALSSEDNIALIIEAPGEEHRILKSLTTKNTIHQCSDIYIRSSRNVLYEDGATSDDIISLLETNAFDCIDLKTGDPDFPAFHARLNAFLYKKQFIAPQVKALKYDNESLAKLLEQKSTELVKKKKLAEGYKSKLQAQQESAQQTLSALKNEHEQSLEQTKRTQDEEIKKTLSAHINEIKNVESKHKQELESLINEKDSRLTELNAELKDLKTSVAERQATIKWLKQKHEEDLSELSQNRSVAPIQPAQGHRVIVVASVPRSGGTWLYNALRLILQKAGHDVIGAWYDDYKPDPNVPYHIVKIHSTNQRIDNPWKIFTTHRVLAQRLSSLVRMGWIKDDDDSLLQAAKGQTDLYNYWNTKSDVEYEFSDIIETPNIIIANLAGNLDIKLSAIEIINIVGTLEKMKAPKKGDPDPVTLMHPDHRGTNNDHSKATLKRIQLLLTDKFPDKD